MSTTPPEDRRTRWNRADPDSAPPALVIGYSPLGETAIRDSISRLTSILT
ncbi:hypothetical protein [Mycolicibacterium peregrinum]|nr:hypothetical protein [Mycolicibacterium peregrinum]